MKLRIKGNSFRLRVTRSELEKLVNDGRVEETIWLGTDARSRQTYALEHTFEVKGATLRFNPPEITVVLPTSEINQWRASDQIGVYATIPLGLRGSLEIIIEKDFACLDLSDADNLDTFPNPRAGAIC